MMAVKIYVHVLFHFNWQWNALYLVDLSQSP